MKVTYEFTDDEELKRAVMDRGYEFYKALGEIYNLVRALWRGKREPMKEEKLFEEIMEYINESGYHDIR